MNFHYSCLLRRSLMMSFCIYLKIWRTLLIVVLLNLIPLKSGHELNRKYKFAKKNKLSMYQLENKVFGEQQSNSNVLQNAWSYHLKKLMSNLNTSRLYKYMWFLRHTLVVVLYLKYAKIRGLGYTWTSESLRIAINLAVLE